jgi:hypothetical protein
LKATGALHLKSSNLFPGVISVFVSVFNGVGKSLGKNAIRFLDIPDFCYARGFDKHGTIYIIVFMWLKHPH